LAGIEMRVMASESGDTRMCGVFQAGGDIHDETAMRIFGISEEEIDKAKHRVPAKRTGFGINYGQGPEGLRVQLWKLGLTNWTRPRCAKMIQGYLATYPGIAAYIKETGRELARDPQAEVRDCWGMPRYLPGIWSKDKGVAAEAARIAVSHKIQGGAQGMVQRSMSWLRDRVWALQDDGANVSWCLQIHDELLLRFDRELWETMDALVMEALTQHCGIELAVPVTADGASAETWADLK